VLLFPRQVLFFTLAPVLDVGFAFAVFAMVLVVQHFFWCCCEMNSNVISAVYETQKTSAAHKNKIRVMKFVMCMKIQKTSAVRKNTIHH
jgi:hypothetical protein